MPENAHFFSHFSHPISRAPLHSASDSVVWLRFTSTLGSTATEPVVSAAVAVVAAAATVTVNEPSASKSAPVCASVSVAVVAPEDAATALTLNPVTAVVSVKWPTLAPLANVAPPPNCRVSVAPLRLPSTNGEGSVALTRTVSVAERTSMLIDSAPSSL